jgi:hypothetical protein
MLGVEFPYLSLSPVRHFALLSYDISFTAGIVTCSNKSAQWIKKWIMFMYSELDGSYRENQEN